MHYPKKEIVIIPMTISFLVKCTAISLTLHQQATWPFSTKGDSSDKMSKDKDASLYIRDTGKYYATAEPRAKVDKNVNFDVTHEDWAWLAPIGCFIPTKFICKMDVGDGVLEFTANVCGCKCVALQADVECDVPNVTLDTDIVEGTFTYKDGRVIELHNGFFINNIVCWRTYPSWIPNFGPQAAYHEVNPMKG